MLIAQSHSDDNHVNATAPCMSQCMHFAQARPPMSCTPLVHVPCSTYSMYYTCTLQYVQYVLYMYLAVRTCTVCIIHVPCSTYSMYYTCTLQYVQYVLYMYLAVRTCTVCIIHVPCSTYSKYYTCTLQYVQ